MTNISKKPQPGEQFHFLRSMAFSSDSTPSGSGTVSRRGQVVTVTDKLLEAGRNRFGDCWLDLLHYPDQQIARWGSVVIAAGPVPDDFTWWTPGPEMDMARENAVLSANALPDPERQRALADVRRTFGGRGSGQVSVRLDGGLPGLDGGVR
jgi:hypothetical protein